MLRFVTPPVWKYQILWFFLSLLTCLIRLQCSLVGLTAHWLVQLESVKCGSIDIRSVRSRHVCPQWCITCLCWVTVLESNLWRMCAVKMCPTPVRTTWTLWTGEVQRMQFWSEKTFDFLSDLRHESVIPQIYSEVGMWFHDGSTSLWCRLPVCLTRHGGLLDCFDNYGHMLIYSLTCKCCKWRIWYNLFNISKYVLLYA